MCAPFLCFLGLALLMRLGIYRQPFQIAFFVMAMDSSTAFHF